MKEVTRLKVCVTAPAINGKANKAAIEALAKYFNIKKREIKIVRGERIRPLKKEAVRLLDADTNRHQMDTTGF